MLEKDAARDDPELDLEAQDLCQCAGQQCMCYTARKGNATRLVDPSCSSPSMALFMKITLAYNQ